MNSYRLALVLLLLPAAAFGTNVTSVTWDLESGNPAFTSDYSLFTFTPTAACPTTNDGAGCSMSEGKYALVTNPFAVHSLFNSINTPDGMDPMMMVVNGALTPGKTVWQADLAQLPLVDGRSYEFSFYLTGIYNRTGVGVGYDNNLASLNVTLGNQMMGIAGANLPPVQNLNPDGSQNPVPRQGAWEEYKFNFVYMAGEVVPIIRLTDTNTWKSGNDFAIAQFRVTDISAVAPEPATWAFAIGGFVAIILLRRRRTS